MTVKSHFIFFFDSLQITIHDYPMREAIVFIDCLTLVS